MAKWKPGTVILRESKKDKENKNNEKILSELAKILYDLILATNNNSTSQRSSKPPEQGGQRCA